MSGTTKLPSHSKRFIRLASCVGTFGLALALVGCSSESDTKTAKAVDSTLAPSTEAVGEGSTPDTTVSNPDDTLVPAVTNLSEQPGASDDGFVGAAKDVTVESCANKDGKWTAAGTVRNQSGASARYRIYVAMNAPGSTDTKALVQATVDVEDGKTAPWSASADVDAPQLTCILRVERANN